MTDTLILDLAPVDVLFFRDGRSFENGRVKSGLPMPQTLAGALRTRLLTRLGCDFGKLNEAQKKGHGFAEALRDQGDALAAVADLRVAGPWLAYQDKGPILVPTPASLHREKGGKALHRLDPLTEPLPGWPPPTTTPGELRPLWLRKNVRSEPADGFLTWDGLHKFLKGAVPDSKDVVDSGDLYCFETRTGIAIKPGGTTVREGGIYTADFLRLKKDVVFRAEVSGLRGDLATALKNEDVLRWGGEGRLARLHKVREGPIRWPALSASAGPQQGDGATVLVTTPALLDGGWRAADWRLLAAAVADPVAVSGWDLARRGPKATRFAVPAGSVFFFERDDPACPREPYLGAEADGLLGYGCYVKGAWNYA
mgnify:CR=1 FL=1